MFSSRWHALGRESELAAEMIAAGVTSLGKAGIGNKSRYLMAFFQLSIGFERAGKIVYIGNYVKSNQGRYPTNKELKAIGHDLKNLFSTLETYDIGVAYGKSPKFPGTTIHREIVRVLSEFAKFSRYYNLDFLSLEDQDRYFDPIQDWHTSVGLQILQRHYSSRNSYRAEVQACKFSEALGQFSTVLSSQIDTTAIEDYYSLLLANNADRYIQRWGRVYTLQIARWLTHLLHGCLSGSPPEIDTEPFFGIEEPFCIFLNDDRYFRERKTWSICSAN